MTYKELYFKYRNEAIKLNKEETAVKLLIQELSNLSSLDFYLSYEKEINAELLNRLIQSIDDYLYKSIPIQYILGYTYFYGLKLIVNKNVLIPRRETEELVDWIIHNNPFENAKVLDIGTGSGAIAISLKANLKNAHLTAIDISEEALEVAKINASVNKQNIEFIQSNLFANIFGTFNIIVSNPPYIAYKEHVTDLVYNNEPHLALFAKQEGLYFYNEIIKESKRFLENKSLLIFEIPEDKDNELRRLCLKYYPNSEHIIKKDLQGKSRILIIKSNWR